MDARPDNFKTSTKKNKKLQAIEMWFSRRMLRTSLSAKNSKETVLREAFTTRSLLNRIRKHQVTFFGPMIRREKLEEYFLTTGMIEGKRSRGRQREKILDGLTKWFKVGRVTEALGTTDRDAWEVMLISTLKRTAFD